MEKVMREWVLRDERPRCHYGRYGPVSCGRSARDLQVDVHRGGWNGGEDAVDGRGEARRAGGKKRVLSQRDNDVSERDRAAKMGKCLSSSPKCPLPDPFRWKLKWRGLDGKLFQFTCKWSNIDSWGGGGGRGFVSSARGSWMREAALR